MERNRLLKYLSWRSVIIFTVIVIAFIHILPTISPGLWPYKRISLGLDLQGGMHLVLEVDVEEPVKGTIERMSHELTRLLREERVRHIGIELIEETRISLKLLHQDGIDRFETLLEREFGDLQILSRTTDNEILTVIMGLSDDAADRIREFAVEHTLETIRDRIDQFGVREPDIRLRGERQILIQLPGITDTERAKELIGKTAVLEFKLVDEVHNMDAVLKGNIPPGREILYEIRKDPATTHTVEIPHLIKKQVLLTGAYLTDARVRIDPEFREPYVFIEFDRKGARIFAIVTEENVNRRLAIILDNMVHSAPVIQEKIAGGEARITGDFTMEEAHDLAIALRAGALPAPVDIIEERTVGPSLGADSIRKGLISMCVGGVIVILFMIIYYKGAGLIANLALILNLGLIAAGLAAFQATLTLPGIAGIILTIGMAVDANVLIFERIREEINLGRTPRAAVIAGYDRATLTILDANITTLIAALVLFQFGTGPIKGFAVTLSMGILASLFTSLVLTRSVFDYLLMNLKIKKLSI